MKFKDLYEAMQEEIEIYKDEIEDLMESEINMSININNGGGVYTDALGENVEFIGLCGTLDVKCVTVFAVGAKLIKFE